MLRPLHTRDLAFKTRSSQAVICSQVFQTASLARSGFPSGTSSIEHLRGRAIVSTFGNHQHSKELKENLTFPFKGRKEVVRAIQTDVPCSDLRPPADNLATAIREYWEDSETDSDRENGEKNDENDY
ncbi:hypothetical protein K438DRAFT_1766837 [Mycena galopus ATCC 62051]|nr:hypothetical protein K438DRAFT_1766837 [Mycena galopus ATCC 62051]